MMARPQLAGLLALLCAATTSVSAVVECDQAGDYTCPDGNTCCASTGGAFACCADEEPGRGVCSHGH